MHFLSSSASGRVCLSAQSQTLGLGQVDHTNSTLTGGGELNLQMGSDRGRREGLCNERGSAKKIKASSVSQTLFVLEVIPWKDMGVSLTFDEMH